MTRVWTLLCGLLLGLSAARGAEDGARTFYVQFVCGSDQATPPAPDAKAVGPALRQRLGSVFKWKHYWELKRHCVQLKAGGKARVVMNPEREAELALLSPDTLAVRLYYRGKLSRSSELPVPKDFAVAGGDTADGQSWFVVVRRDKPAEE